jgi:hypothetical protein
LRWKTSELHFSCKENVYSVSRVALGCWSYYHQLTLGGVIMFYRAELLPHPIIHSPTKVTGHEGATWSYLLSEVGQPLASNPNIIACNPVSLINQLINSATTYIFLWHEVQWARWVDKSFMYMNGYSGWNKDIEIIILDWCILSKSW